MRPPKIINYPKIVRAMHTNTNIPERTITIKNKAGRDSIQSEFIGFYAKRENPLDFVTNIISDLGNLIDKLSKNKHAKS